MLEYNVVQSFHNLPQKRVTAVLTEKCNAYTVAFKVLKYLGYFCSKICSQELSKIAQSGHTGPQQELFKIHFVDSTFLAQDKRREWKSCSFSKFGG